MSERHVSFDLATLRRLNPSGLCKIDVACPSCGPECKTPANRRRKVLRIWDDGDFITYKCARCEAHGWMHDKDGQHVAARPAKPEAPPKRDRAELARYLWSISQPLAGSPAETYLRSRQCFIESPSIRFLAGRGDHAPAMISRFGTVEVNGIHLTKLNPDGTGKAGTDTDKIMIGPSVGQPIIVLDNIERQELILAEGIEDTASLAMATGWSAWAAGAAGRLANVIATASRFSPVYVAVDNDHAGRAALAKCLAVRPDLIPLRLSKVFSPSTGMDANKALQRFGADMLLGAIEWCDAQTRFSRGIIGFHAMQAEMARMETLSRTLAPAI